MKASRGYARLGLLVPFTNSNLEPDFALMCPDGFSIHVARLGGYDEEEIPDESQMRGLGASDLDEPIRLLAGVRPEVMIYGCTSATLTHGPEFDQELALRIAEKSGAKTVTAAGALVFALSALQAKRIAFASPYVSAINDLAIQFLSEMGIETCARAEVAAPLSNEGQGAMSPDDVFALGLRADTDTADALVLSCTDMRSVEVIDRLEQAIGKPVVCSNQAMLFQVLALLGEQKPISGFGTLLQHPQMMSARQPNTGVI